MCIKKVLGKAIKISIFLNLFKILFANLSLNVFNYDKILESVEKKIS